MSWTRLTFALVVCAFLGASAFASDSSNGKEVVGKLGQAVEKAKIYSRASTRSPVYYTLAEYQYIVINPYEKDEWLKVLLKNGKHGFVEAKKIARLPYDVSKNGGKAPTGDASEVTKMSFAYMGTPYKWGGNDLNKGIDCSGFVKELFEKVGVDLPRTAAEQYKVGKPVKTIGELKPGDRLYFWEEKRGLIGHTGIFLGHRQDGGAYFIHSSRGNGGVATDDLRDPKWMKLLVAARR